MDVTFEVVLTDPSQKLEQKKSSAALDTYNLCLE